jgi:hypothetical protein
MSSPHFPLKSILATSWLLANIIGGSAPLLAQSSEQVPIRFILANPDPPNRGTPPSNAGTGSRGDCLSKPERPSMRALVGSQNLELTVKERPTFWIYVPYTQQEAPSGEFSLQDEAGENELYRVRFQLPTTPGIVGISLPPTTQPLEIGTTYRWYFELNCTPPELPALSTPAFIRGMVRRVSPSVELERELSAATTPLERIAAYARHSIWFETLTELAQLRLNEPQDSVVEEAWIELLSDRKIGLDAIAQEPIAGTVTASSPPE